MSLVDDDDENQRRPEEYLRSLYERKTGAHIPAAVERRVWEAVELRGVSRADFVISLRPHADNAWRNPAGFLTAFARRCGVPTVDVPVASPEPPRNAHGRCARCNGVGKLDGEWCSCALGRDFRGLELRALGRKQIESESAMSEVKYCGQSVQ